MTQEQLAELLDLDTQYYAQLERGERNFTIEKIIRLCNIFHVGIEKIIEIDIEKNPDTRELLDRILPLMEQLSYSQLSLIENLLLILSLTLNSVGVQGAIRLAAPTLVSIDRRFKIWIKMAE